MKKQRFVFLPVLLFLTCGNSYAPSILKIEQKHKNQNSVLRDLSAKSTMISSYTMTYNGSFVPGNMVKLQYTGDFNSSTCGFIYVNLESIGYKKSDYRSFSISIKGNFIPSGADYFIKDYYGLSSFACSMSNGIISFDATKLTLQNGSVAGCLYHLTPSSAIIENYNPYDISYSYKLKKHHDSFHSEQNYGDDYYQMMYIDIPEGYYDDIPVVMNIYGSNYHRGDIEAYSYLQEPLFENKFVQVRFDYRTSNELSSRPYLPYMMDDIRQAINKIKKNSRYGHRLSEFQHQYRKNLLMGAFLRRKSRIRLFYIRKQCLNTSDFGDFRRSTNKFWKGS